MLKKLIMHASWIVRHYEGIVIPVIIWTRGEGKPLPVVIPLSPFSIPVKTGIQCTTTIPPPYGVCRGTACRALCHSERSEESVIPTMSF